MNGHLIKFFYFEKDGTTFLEEESMYNRKGKLAHQTKRDEVKRTINGKDSTYIHQINELRIYTIYGSLKEVWLKSSYQDDYFIKEKYSYTNTNLLLKRESFNSNIRTEYHITCRGSSVDTDYVELYTYDARNRLIEKKVYAYEYHFDEDNYTAIERRNFSEYMLHKSIKYKYNERNLIVKELRKHFGGYLEGSVNTITRKYDYKNRLIEDMTIHRVGHGSGHIYEYYEKNGELDKVIVIYTRKKVRVKTILKRIGYVTEKENDNFVRYDYSNGKLVEIEKYDKYGDEIMNKDLDDRENRTYEYVYDKCGNWTSRVLFEKGIKKEKIVRELEYYSE